MELGAGGADLADDSVDVSGGTIILEEPVRVRLSRVRISNAFSSVNCGSSVIIDDEKHIYRY